MENEELKMSILGFGAAVAAGETSGDADEVREMAIHLTQRSGWDDCEAPEFKEKFDEMIDALNDSIAKENEIIRKYSKPACPKCANNDEACRECSTAAGR